jgi:hypothetical protein
LVNDNLRRTLFFTASWALENGFGWTSEELSNMIIYSLPVIIYSLPVRLSKMPRNSVEVKAVEIV